MVLDEKDIERIAKATADQVVAQMKEEHDLKWFEAAPLIKIAEYLEQDEDETAENYKALANRIELILPEAAPYLRDVAAQEASHSTFFSSVYSGLKRAENTAQSLRI